MTDSEKEIYNKALDDVLKEAEEYGIVSDSVTFTFLQKYNCPLDEETVNKVNDMFCSDAISGLTLAIDNLRQPISD